MNTIKKLIALLFIIWLTNPIDAQTIVALSFEKIFYDDNERPSTAVIIEPEAKEVKKAFEDFLKDKYGFNLKGIGLFANKDVVYAEEVQLDKLSDKRINFYAKVVEEGKLTKMNVFATFGYDVNISRENYPKEFESLELIVVQFLNAYLPEYYKEQVVLATKILEEFRDEKSTLQNTISKNEEELKDLEKNIKKLRKENKDIVKEVKKTSRQITESEALVKVQKERQKTVLNQLKRLQF